MKYLVKIALGLFVYMAAVASCKDDDDSGITGFSIDKTRSTSLSPRRSPIPTSRLPDGPFRLIGTDSPQLPPSTRKPATL